LSEGVRRKASAWGRDKKIRNGYGFRGIIGVGGLFVSTNFILQS
jgi:hypothetical protein